MLALQHYHNDLNMRFGGIRKPRLGNTDTLNMARQRGWILSQSAGGSGGARNLNYSIPAGPRQCGLSMAMCFFLACEDLFASVFFIAFFIAPTLLTCGSARLVRLADCPLFARWRRFLVER
jgi:hypothetical protein